MTQHDLFGGAPSQAANVRQVRKPDGFSRYTWFFALRPPIEEARRIHAFAADLLAFHGVPGKIVLPERLHITLDVVGYDDVDETVAEAALRAGDAISSPRLDVRFEAAMSFSGPLVLVGGEGTDAVRKLRTDLGCALADRGFKPPRSYEPHMTLSYDAQRRLAKTPIGPIGFRAGEFALIKSHVGLSRHEIMRTWRLTG